MRRTVLIAAIITASLAPQAFGEFRVVVSTGLTANGPRVLPDPGAWELYENWTRRPVLAVTAEHDLSPHLALTSTLEYDRRYFQPRQAGYPFAYQKLTANDATVYRMFLEARLFMQTTGRIRQYLTGGLCYVQEDLGRWRFDWVDEDGKAQKYFFSFKSHGYVAQTLGVGMRCFISRSVGVDGLVRYFSNYHDRFETAWRVGIVCILSH